MHSGLLYSATVLIWGSTWLAIKYQLGEVAPMVSIAHRMALAAVLTLLLARTLGNSLRLEPRDRPWVFLQGMCLFCCNYLLLYTATMHLTSGLVAVVFSTMVILNALGGALFLAVPLRGAVLTGGVLGLAGMAVLFFPEIRELHGGGERGRALLLCFGGTVMASTGNLIAARNLRRGLPVLATNGWGMVCGAAVLYCLALLLGVPVAFDWRPSYLASLLYLALVGTVLAFWAYISLIGRIGPDRAAYSTLIFPLVALLLSTLVEAYRWTGSALLGLSLVLCGNWLAMRGVRR